MYDALGVSHQRANALYDLYEHTEQSLGMKIHHVIGNHDVFGVSSQNGASPHNLGFGKAMYEERMGRTYYSFDHKGYHFIVLDSIQIVDPTTWQGGVDVAQLAWLRQDLAFLREGMPIVAIVHVPLVTGALSYVPAKTRKDSLMFVVNANEVLSLWQGKNVLAVFSGPYAHQRSSCLPRHSIRFMWSSLRKLVARPAVGNAGRLYCCSPPRRKDRLAL